MKPGRIRGCCCTRHSPPQQNGLPPRTRPPQRTCSDTLAGRPGTPPPQLLAREHGMPLVLVHGKQPLVQVHGSSLVLVPLALGHGKLVLHGLDCERLVRGGLNCGEQVRGGLDCARSVRGGLDCGGEVQNERQCCAKQRDVQEGGDPVLGDQCHHGTQAHGVPNPLHDVRLQYVPPHDDPRPHHAVQLHGAQAQDDPNPPHEAQLHGAQHQHHGFHGLFQVGQLNVHQYALHDGQVQHVGSLVLDALHGGSHAHGQRA